MVSPAACHILLLEDDPAISALLEASLKRAGFCQVRSSSSIAGARQCWHAQLGKFDVVISDFSLPDGCAPAFIEELVRYKPDLRVILMSGFSEEDLEMPAGVTRHLAVLQKPFAPDELIEAVMAGLSPSAMC
jgi:two-component system, cell cycle sensor histidine kinase and response regulator CckA